MADTNTGRRLPDAPPDRLREAVRAVLGRQAADMPAETVDARALIGRLPSTLKLKSDAEHAIAASTADADAAERFRSLLELGYLVASADGLAEQEREALALLVEHATDSVVDRATLQLHFSDLDATCEALGRRERLQWAAATFDSAATQQEALSFAALVAIADGTLDQAELAVLVELGAHYDLSEEHVGSVVDRVVADLTKQLEG
ncbi:MAG: hypothetical protein JRI23_23165 [Deltaproteobacteria bacterium]|jgi:tellurite resistance protein|nr:hypothetical protein [Deltaproteobacteria bacterium]MBW2534873.1 hypothetical protein [Deltaproteobacteria bacterium]